MFGRLHASLLLFLLFSSICFADTRTDQPPLLIEETDGTNAGRYRVLKVSTGTSTNNGDGSLTVTTGSGGGGGGSPGGVATNLQYYVNSTTFGGISGSSTSSGNVGIGSLTPSSKLTVYTSDGNNSFKVFQPGFTSINIDQGGTVGIGTAFPDVNQFLDVNGPARFHNGSIVFDMNTAVQDFTIKDSYSGNGNALYFAGNNTGDYVAIGNCGSGSATSNLSVCRAFGSTSSAVTNFNSATTTLTSTGNISKQRYNSFFAPTINGTGNTITDSATVYIDQGPVGVATFINGSALRIDSGNLLVMAGNVGIGTSDPQARLIVKNGNVGIGTITAAKNLDIVGTIGATGHVTFEGVTSTGATGTGLLAFGTSPVFITPALGTPTSGLLTNATGLPEGGLALTDITTNNVTTSAHGFTPKGDNNSAHFLNGQLGWTTPAGGGGSSQWITTTSVGIGTYDNVGIGTLSSQAKLVVLGGNVGIGTWTAAQTLDIVGTAKVSGHVTLEGVTSTGATGIGKFVFDGTPTLVTPALGAATYTTLNGGAITDSGLTSGRVTFASTAGLLADDSDLTFLTDTLTATKIAATTFTGSITTVGVSNGTTAITNSAAYTQSGSNVNTFTGNTGFTGNVGIGTTAAQAPLSVMSGNVGIGTYSPTQLLQVNGTIQSTSAGNVGIGTLNPGTLLDVNGGNIRASGTLILTGIASDSGKTDATICEDTTVHQLYSGSGTLGICLGTSTVMAKQNIFPISEGINQIMALKPIVFNYRPGWGFDPKKPYYGFLAEDVYPILPNLVGHNEKGEIKSADYVGMIPIMVKSIQQLKKEVDELKKLQKGE